MVKYLLDTNHIIDMIKDRKDMQKTISDIGPELFAISEITLAELAVYAYKKGTARHREELKLLTKKFKIIPFNAHNEFGQIKALLEIQGQRIEDMDILIAASAVQNRLILCTSDNDFKNIENLDKINLRNS
jgi:predicted nucleic acid-binding protein